MKAHAVLSEPPHLGFQIAPMVDVVFVIMLFFMVMAGAIKSEHLLSTTIPGGGAQPGGCPDETILLVADDGYVFLNEEEIGQPGDRSLHTLTARMSQLRRDNDDRGAILLVTLQTEEQARYQRIVDVMSALAKAKVTNVTFTVGSE
jgi:biopolymer transport protein ExbD